MKSTSVPAAPLLKRSLIGTAIGALVLGCLVIQAAPASAEQTGPPAAETLEPSREEQAYALVSVVAAAADRQAAFDQLTPAEQQLVREAALPVSSESGTSGDAGIESTGCWDYSSYHSERNVFGGEVYRLNLGTQTCFHPNGYVDQATSYMTFNYATVSPLWTYHGLTGNGRKFGNVTHKEFIQGHFESVGIELCVPFLPICTDLSENKYECLQNVVQGTGTTNPPNAYATRSCTF